MPQDTESALVKRLKEFLPPAVWRWVRATGTAILTPFRFSIRSGHWRSSWRGLAVDRVGLPIPWYTYPAISFLSCRDFTGRSVLEFGGGQSTRWWSSRASSVLTIEENREWHDALASSRLPGVELHHVPVDIESRSVDEVLTVLTKRPKQLFDIIVIDGHLRREITRFAFDILAPGGAMVLDDADGYGFHEELLLHNCSRVDFFGYAPGGIRPHCTSIVWVGRCFLFEPKCPMPTEE